MATPAASADQPGGPTKSDIFAQLHVDEVPADYVVMVDTSGSMATDGRYGTAIQALTGLFDALSTEDRVALYTFDSSVNPAYLGPSMSPADITGRLPGQPTGGATDLGRVISVALDELQRQDAAPVANVVFITDGDHDAPAGSPYADLSAPAWEVLRQRANTTNVPMVSVYAVPLGDQTSGADVVKSVFTGATVLDPGSVQSLGEYLGRSKDRVRIEKARTVLAPDIGRTVAATWDVGPAKDGTADVTVTLTSKTEHIPIDVDKLRLTADDAAIRLDQPDPHVVIAPGGSVQVDGSVHYRPSSGFPIERTSSTDAVLTLSAAVSSPWTEVLKPEIDLRVDGPLTTSSKPVALSREVGSPWLLPTGVATLVMLAAGTFLVFRLRRQVLSGTLVVYSGDQETTIAQVPLSGSRMRLTANELPGSGLVRPVRSIWPRRNGHEVELKISYSGVPGTQSDVTRRCGSGGTIILGGLFFSHVKEGS
jgi:hypothetical protein